MNPETAALVAASLNLVAALVGFPVLWDRVSRLTKEVYELRGNVRQLELGRHNPAGPQKEVAHG